MNVSFVNRKAAKKALVTVGCSLQDFVPSNDSNKVGPALADAVRRSAKTMPGAKSWVGVADLYEAVWGAVRPENKTGPSSVIILPSAS